MVHLDKKRVSAEIETDAKPGTSKIQGMESDNLNLANLDIPDVDAINNVSIVTIQCFNGKHIYFIGSCTILETFDSLIH